MTVPDRAINMEEETRSSDETVAAAAASKETKNLFNVLAEAEQAHHDALVEIKDAVCPRASQFKVLQGKMCLFRTSPGKA
jgi:rubrerythrin